MVLTSPMHPDTVLRRAPALTVRIPSATETIIEHGGGVVHCGAHALAVLEAFAQPTRVADAVDRLHARASGAQDWMDLTSTVAQLHRAGVLVDDASRASAPAALGWESMSLHVRILSDRTRTSRFLEGVARVVRPGDVVVDIGTGTGVLAVAAARAGAGRVYAIEEDEIAEAAKAMFRANGVSDRVTLIRGRSTQVELPQRADVLLCELIGDDALGEALLEIVADARRRLLRPGARVLPARLSILGVPLQVPADVLLRRSLAGETPDRWREWYGMDFSPFAAMAGEGPVVFYLPPQEARDWRSLTDPVTLAKLDLQSLEETAIDASAVAVARTDGVVSGVLVYFELEVAPGIRLTTAPAAADPGNHWKTPVWILSRRAPVAPGDRIRVGYRYRAAGGTGAEGVTVDRIP